MIGTRVEMSAEPLINVARDFMSTEKLTMAEQVAAKTREAGPDHDPPSSLALPLALYRAVTAFGRVAVDELTPVDLSMSQFNVLTVLKRADGPMTMGALADSISVRQASLTSVVDTLTKAGFVTRKVNPPRSALGCGRDIEEGRSVHDRVSARSLRLSAETLCRYQPATQAAAACTTERTNRLFGELPEWPAHLLIGPRV